MGKTWYTATSKLFVLRTFAVRYLTHLHSYQDNVVIDLEGRALICDFGSARFYYNSLSIANVSSAVRGTLAYWAPELVSITARTTNTKATDVWAFGMTVYVRLYTIAR